MTEHVSDIAFTPAVKAQQERLGSRKGFQRRIEKRDWSSELSDDLKAFIAERNSFYFATASADSQPYIQHRGGPAGFLKVLGPSTLGFADYSGNRQYITAGNLSENDKAYIFLMDYMNQRRVKLWGRARIVEDDAQLITQLMPEGYEARPERAVVFDVAAWDINCPQHIPQKFDVAMVEAATEEITSRLAARIRELEAEVASLKQSG